MRPAIEPATPAPGGTSTAEPDPASPARHRHAPAPPTQAPPGREPISAPGSLLRAEWRAMAALCGVYGLRLLGLYMVLPVLSLYARGLPGSTAFLTGLSLGAYGFANMLLVLPYGMLSDAIGRRRVIALGLAVFALGSFLAAWAPTIAWLLVARTLQGAGAVSSVVVALVGDVTRPQVRARAMALLGASVAVAFAIGVVGGPALAGEFGVGSLFLLTGILSIAAIVVVLAAVPRTAPLVHYDEYEPRVEEVGAVLLRPELLKLDAGMFLIHLALTALFVVIPILLDPLLPTHHLWRVYGPLVVLGLAVMLPTMAYAEKFRAVHRVLGAGITLFGLAFLALRLFGETLPGIIVGLGLFVMAFSLLEPTLTTLLTRYSAATSRGTAAGVFNMSGFLGAFIGGAMGGLLLERHQDLFLVLAAASLAWLLAALRMRMI